MLSLGLWLQSLSGEVLELLVDEGLASSYHWCHWLNNIPGAGKRGTLTLRHAEPGGAQAPAGALEPPFLEIQVLTTIPKIGAKSQRAPSWSRDLI